MGWWPLFILFQDGTLIDDYRQAYGWLRQNTASDARIMAWWDYGALARTGGPKTDPVILSLGDPVPLDYPSACSS